MSDETIQAPPVSADTPETPQQTVAVPEASPVPEKKEEKLSKIYTVPSVFKSKLAHITNIEAKEGFVTLYTNDGKVHRKTAEEVRDVARACAATLASMQAAKARGVNVPRYVEEQTKELITKLSAAWRKAKHQQESALKMDHVPRAMQRMTDNLAWQKGELNSERGAYTADGLPEEANVKHYLTRFPTLKEGEIATVLRATDMPFNLRIQILCAMNGKRIMEANKIDTKDVMRMMGTVEVPTGVGMKMPKLASPKIQISRP